MAFIHKEARQPPPSWPTAGGTSPAYPGSRYDGNGVGRMRNATVTTIAPTGTISIIAGAQRHRTPVCHLLRAPGAGGHRTGGSPPLFEELARRRGFYSPELMRAVAQTGSIRDFKEIPKDVRRLFVTAHEVSPQWHIRLQAAFQKYTDNAVQNRELPPPGHPRGRAPGLPHGL
jgi:ribonucleoside-diphosphate reductase alpha chain